MSIHPERVRWNRRYSDARFAPDWAPDLVLARHLPEFPQGRALDAACGIGANALFLAKRGYDVDALDLSDVALEHLRRAARAEGVTPSIRLVQGALAVTPLDRAAYDLITCIRFLDRDSMPRLQAALRPGGVLLYRAWSRSLLQRRPDFPEGWLLRPGELPELLPGLEVLQYEEGDAHDPDLVTLVGRRPR